MEVGLWSRSGLVVSFRRVVASWRICWLQRPKEDRMRRLSGTVMGVTGSFGSMVSLLHVREGFDVARVVLGHWNMRGKFRLGLRLMGINVIGGRGARLLVPWWRAWVRVLVDWLRSPTIGRHLVGGRFLQTV